MVTATVYSLLWKGAAAAEQPSGRIGHQKVDARRHAALGSRSSAGHRSCDKTEIKDDDQDDPQGKHQRGEVLMIDIVGQYRAEHDGECADGACRANTGIIDGSF